ncbi:hypothetical protein D8674_013747 [Pyrus ussuriensis x Pyrus communis]|uniref:Precursor of CEP9-like n=1 Tax=Pyrus ussuriensis x Pyrus communis TaxID=2448454 RepID=A0A5N5GRG4_9ROSA|nr:hypothetical protein D8674_013747 [Pyrus ussuriensis x Pyrus communis]
MEAKCAILLAFIACIEIVCIEGRPFLPKNKESINTVEANPKRELGEQVRQPASHHLIASPKTLHSTAHNFGDISGSHAAYKDDFRPTTAGNSPGVGHKFTKSREYMGPKADDFVGAGKPTGPGHSPGVGHVLQVQNAKPIP